MQEKLTDRMLHAAAHCEGMYDLLDEALALREGAAEIERLRILIADLKAWDVNQYMNIPHDLRARMQAELTPNA